MSEQPRGAGRDDAPATATEPAERSTELERLIFFSDAIFAIAITLLVLDIKIPEIPGTQAEAELPARLRDLAPNILSYVISFLVIASYWLTHHRIFAYIRRYDRRLLWLNIYFLLFVAFLPFPTGLMGRYGDTHFAFTFYALLQVAIGLLLAAIWWHASRQHRLIDAALGDREIRTQLLRILSVPLIFALSIGVAAAFGTTVGEFSWLLIAFSRRLANRIVRHKNNE